MQQKKSVHSESWSLHGSGSFWWYGGNAFVGAFYGLFVIYVLALLLISSLPLAAALKTTRQQVARSYAELFKQPLLVAAMASGAIGYAVMVLTLLSVCSMLSTAVVTRCRASR